MTVTTAVAIAKEGVCEDSLKYLPAAFCSGTERTCPGIASRYGSAVSFSSASLLESQHLQCLQRLPCPAMATHVTGRCGGHAERLSMGAKREDGNIFQRRVRSTMRRCILVLDGAWQLSATGVQADAGNKDRREPSMLERGELDIATECIWGCCCAEA